MLIISQLWLISHPRSTVVLLDIGTPGTSREIYSEDADDGTVGCTMQPVVVVCTLINFIRSHNS